MRATAARVRVALDDPAELPAPPLARLAGAMLFQALCDAVDDRLRPGTRHQARRWLQGFEPGAVLTVATCCDACDVTPATVRRWLRHVHTVGDVRALQARRPTF